eukprot:2882402-Ditylum_brightwellii.AAC.1
MQSLIGKLDVDSLKFGGGQICVHFPTDPETGNDTPFAPDFVSEAHIDGVPSVHNRVPEYRPFTALVGVALSNELDNFKGNLVVYPGSHKKAADILLQRRDKKLSLWPENNSHMYPEGILDDIELIQLKMNI